MDTSYRQYVDARIVAMQVAVRDARETWELCQGLVHDLEDLDPTWIEPSLREDCEALRLRYARLLADLVAFTREHVFLPDATTEEV